MTMWSFVRNLSNLADLSRKALEPRKSASFGRPYFFNLGMPGLSSISRRRSPWLRCDSWPEDLWSGTGRKDHRGHHGPLWGVSFSRLTVAETFASCDLLLLTSSLICWCLSGLASTRIVRIFWVFPCIILALYTHKRLTRLSSSRSTIWNFPPRFSWGLWNYGTDEGIRKILVSSGKELQSLQEAPFARKIAWEIFPVEKKVVERFSTTFTTHLGHG